MNLEVKLLVFFTLFLFTPLIIYPSGKYISRTWTESDGLPNNTVF